MDADGSAIGPEAGRLYTRVQDQLETIYRVQCPARAEAFMVDDHVARQLGGSGNREQLFVREAEDGLDLALYLEPALLARLEQCTHRTLLEGELDGYCQVAEGISHFMYLTQAAIHERRVSLLELEAQAEVDKFALCLLHRWGAGALHWARELIRRLFDSARLLPSLSPELRHRYEESSRLARTYCHRLLVHVQSHQLDRLLTELRYSYRLGAEAKLRYLAQPA